MSLDRHHPNREVDRNLARARDLRSAFLFACLSAIGGFIAFGLGRGRASAAPDLEMPAGTLGPQST